MNLLNLNIVTLIFIFQVMVLLYVAIPWYLGIIFGIFKNGNPRDHFQGVLTDFFRLLDNHYFQLTSAK